MLESMTNPITSSYTGLKRFAHNMKEAYDDVAARRLYMRDLLPENNASEEQLYFDQEQFEAPKTWYLPQYRPESRFKSLQNEFSSKIKEREALSRKIKASNFYKILLDIKEKNIRCDTTSQNQQNPKEQLECILTKFVNNHCANHLERYDADAKNTCKKHVSLYVHKAQNEYNYLYEQYLDLHKQLVAMKQSTDKYKFPEKLSEFINKTLHVLIQKYKQQNRDRETELKNLQATFRQTLKNIKTQHPDLLSREAIIELGKLYEEIKNDSLINRLPEIDSHLKDLAKSSELSTTRTYAEPNYLSTLLTESDAQSSLLSPAGDAPVQTPQATNPTESDAQSSLLSPAAETPVQTPQPTSSIPSASALAQVRENHSLPINLYRGPWDSLQHRIAPQRSWWPW